MSNLPSSPPPTTRTRSLRIALLAVGSALVAAALVLTTVQVVDAATVPDASERVAVPASFATIQADVDAADVSVRYGDVAETTLDFRSSAVPLRLEHEVRGDTLALRVDRRGWWSLGLLPRFGTARLEVVLPRSLAPVALDVRSSAGDTVVAGDFATTALSTSAGDIEISGSTGELRMTSSAGDLTATGLAVRGALTTDASAGDTELSLTSLPTSIQVEASAGDIEAALPDGEYEITTSTSFGDIEQGLRSTPGADRRYRFETSAGDIGLRIR